MQKTTNFFIKNKYIILYILLFLITSIYFYFNLFWFIMWVIDSPNELIINVATKSEIIHLILFWLLNIFLIILSMFDKIKIKYIYIFLLFYLILYISFIDIFRLYY